MAAEKPGTDTRAGARSLRLQVALFIIALAIRAGVVMARNPSAQFPDTCEYRAIADSLRSGHGFLLGADPQSARPPAYPAFLALGLALGAGSLRGALLLQALLSALTVFPLVTMARRLTGSTGGALVAGVLFVLDPLSVYFGALALSETLYTFLIVVALERLSCGLMGGGAPGGPTASPWSYAVSGVLIALAALTRAQAVAFAPLLALGIAITLRPVRAALRPAMALLAGFAITLAPWVVRNLGVYDGFVPVALGAGTLLYESNNPMFALVPWPDGIPHPALPAGLTREGVDQEWKRRAIECMRANPGGVIARAPFQLARLYAFTPNAPGYRGGIFALVLATATIPVYLLAPVGLLIRGLRRTAPIAIIVGFTSCIHTILLGSVRYRAPLMPLLSVLAGAGLVATMQRYSPGLVRQFDCVSDTATEEL